MKIVIILHSNLGYGHYVRGRIIANALQTIGHDVVVLYSGQPVSKQFWGSLKTKKIYDNDYWIAKGNKLVYNRQHDYSSELEGLPRLLNLVQPQLVIFEHSPFAKARYCIEFERISSFCRHRFNSKIVITLRDFVEEKENLNELQILSYIDKGLIDSIIIQSDHRILDSPISELLSSFKSIFYSGVLVKDTGLRKVPNEKKYSILISAGRGVDSKQYIANIKDKLNIVNLSHLEVFLSGAIDHTNTWSNCKIVEFDDLKEFRRTTNHVSINMAGYNTLYENVIYGIPSILYFRNRYEQRKRLRLAVENRLAISIDDFFSETTLKKYLADFAIHRDKFVSQTKFDLNGKRFAEYINSNL